MKGRKQMDIKRTEKNKKRTGFFEISKPFKEDKQKSSEIYGGSIKIALNICAVGLGFLFGGCHLVFGSYPLGLGFVSALPCCVWPALLGAALGSLTLGRSGIIYAMICVLAVFLRVIISGGEKKEAQGEVSLFSEKLSFRVCSAVIGGFVAALYEIFLGGFGLNSILFGVFMILLSGLSCFLFCGVFGYGIGIRELFFGGRRVFGEYFDKQSIKAIFFKISLLSYLLLISLSLDKYAIFGIDISLVFSGAVTLFAAKRFGALYGAVAGFISSVGITGLYSVAFALLGAAAGGLFVFGSWYAITGGCVLLSVWGAYVGGVSGFFSVFPEFVISLCIMMPLFRYLEREAGEDKADTDKRKATDMVGTMALSYRSKKALEIELIEDVISSLTPEIKNFCENDIISESYAAFSMLCTEAKMSLLRDREIDEGLTDELEVAFENCGFSDGVIRAFGRRKKCVICSGKDSEGIKITSPLLKREIEERSGLKFKTPEYYRRGDMVLMGCESTKKYKLEGAYAQNQNKNGEVSGDTADIFESKEMFAYGLISDGMGSGNEAKRTSEFVLSFLKCALQLGGFYTPIMHMLNSAVRRKREECGATVDLFCFDLVNGEAYFIKSGAAPSFVKRGGSIFRIKSETMPLGFIGQVDAEKTSVKVGLGDYIIMLSDGVCQIGEEVPWLIELLSGEAPDNLEEYASLIMEEAKKNGKGEDDMSVLVLKVGHL